MSAEPQLLNGPMRHQGGGDASEPLPKHPTLAGAVQIVEAIEEEHLFRLDEDALSELLFHPDIADKKVSVLSVAGAFRKGKSFLLNFFLRFLQNDGTNESDGWMGSPESELSGFNWRGGSERETNGILLWKEPFLIQMPDGEEIVLLLMDTQGAFDSLSTVKDCATVFALSTMLSSVQIYNLSQNVQEDDLQHLQLFTEYGRLALESTDAKPFQSLLFLVRDWSFPYEAEFGFLGGQRILDRRLLVSDKQHPELQQLRRHIRSCFTNTQAFLLPHPGLKVATSPQFRGQLSEIETEFKQQLRHLVARLLSPEHIVLKRINGETLSCRELMEYFKAYIQIFQGEELPEPKSMLLATAEANNLAAVANAKAIYCRGMEEVCGGETPYMSPDDLSSEHERCREDAIGLFRTTRKMGGDDYSFAFLERLDDEITESYENFVKVNNSKNLFRSARTPAVLFVLLLVVYVFQEIFQLLYLDGVASIFSMGIGLLLLTLSIWAYARYSGNLRELGATIDEFADVVWTNVLCPLSNFAMSEGVKRAETLQRKLSEAPSRKASSIPKSSRVSRPPSFLRKEE